MIAAALGGGEPMRYWQITLTSDDERPPGKVVRTLGIPAVDEDEAMAQTLARVGPAAYGATIVVDEIPPAQWRDRESALS